MTFAGTGGDVSYTFNIDSRTQITIHAPAIQQIAGLAAVSTRRNSDTDRFHRPRGWLSAACTSCTTIGINFSTPAALRCWASHMNCRA